MTAMEFENPIVLILGGLTLLGTIILVLGPRLSKAARMERRRRKNNSRVVNTSGRPTVKFSVHTKDKK